MRSMHETIKTKNFYANNLGALFEILTAVTLYWTILFDKQQI